MSSVRFYFDVVCPYAFLGSTQLDALTQATGASIVLRPILLGGLFRQIGQVDDPNQLMPPAKVAHGRRDLARWAHRYGVPLRMPSAHPRRSVLAMRVLHAASEPERVRAMHAIFAAYWIAGLDIADGVVLARGLEEAGLDGERLVASADSAEARAALRACTDEAAAAGVFGVPSFVIGEGSGAELFWGQDRLAWVRDRLRSPLRA
ncbi:MAG: 2-hydroxychromene-2-carboxylate isomerase [Sandaracinaceae bacterium]|nr:2-hydroxychromene-2-carboxylate isomerase [Sandaracinaceae bacterium]